MLPAITKIITDMDGVLIDSEQLAMRVMDTEAVALVERSVPNHGMPKDHVYREYPGTSTNKIVLAMIEQFNLPLDDIEAHYKIGARPDETEDEQKARIEKALADAGYADGGAPEALIASLQERAPETEEERKIRYSDVVAEDVTRKTLEYFKQNLKAVPGAVKSFGQIRGAFGPENFALATTSPEGRMNVSLDHAKDPVTGDNAGLAEIFPEGSHRRSGYKFDNKYDDAFDALGFDPAETVIVEDSVSGVKKAKAGRPEVRVIGTVAAVFYENKGQQGMKLLEAGADIIVSDMEDLPRALKWLDNGLDPHNAPEFKGIVYLPTDNHNPLGYSRTPSYGAPKATLN